MTVSAINRRQVRERADFACEYCGVTEIDAGGELTLDHYWPQAVGGGDGLENLIYCCIRCNLHKGDYWPADEEQLSLWNPRRNNFSAHFLLDKGVLRPLTETAAFTIERLHFNRPQLVAHRRRKQRQEDMARLLVTHQEAIEIIKLLAAQEIELLGSKQANTEEWQTLMHTMLIRNL